MKDLEYELVSEVKLSALAKSIYNESVEMGFKSNDYVKLMNELLDMTINKQKFDSVNQVTIPEELSEPTDLPITTENLIIRYYNPEKDIKTVMKWFNDPNNRLFLPSLISEEILDVDQMKNSPKNVFGIISLKNNKAIGMMALLNIDEENSKAEMRKLIGDFDSRGKGFAKEATSAWLKFSTEFLKINKIYIHTIETNIRNVSINRQLGLHVEGLLKGEYKIDEKRHDVLRMAYFKR